MPLFGIRDIAPLLEGTSKLADYDTEPLLLKGATVFQAMFELRKEAMLTLIPPALHPTIPPIVVFVVTNCPDSPFGPFALAEARVGCRAGARPRGFVARAFASTGAAASALGSRWGYPAAEAQVALENGYDRTRAVVKAGGRPILDVSLMNPEAISGGDIQYLANMNLARVGENGDEAARLIQVDPEYQFHKADRGKPRLDVFDSDVWAMANADPWWPVSASVAVVDMELPALRYVVDPLRPAVEGLEQIRG